MESYRGTPIDRFVPIDVTEIILSRLPVKSLIRFQSVSKSWRAIISDPQFRRIHYDTTNTDALASFVEALNYFPDHDSVHLLKLENKKLATEFVLESPFVESHNLVCSCNGILLMAKAYPQDVMGYGLWNPSIRKYSYIEPCTPSRYIESSALYYDSAIDDYKIAVVFDKYYAVYSCKSGNWGERKAFPPATGLERRLVNVNGSSSFYWLESEEILGFDVRNDELSKIPLPIAGNLDLKFFVLISLSGRLCLLHRTKGVRVRMWVMEKHDNSWRELVNTAEDDATVRGWRPLLLTDEDDLVVRNYYDEFLKYDCVEKRVEKLEYCGRRDFWRMLPYSESLHFPVMNVALKIDRRHCYEQSLFFL